MATKMLDRLFLLSRGGKRLREGLPTIRVRVQSRRSLVQALDDALPSDLWMTDIPGAEERLLHEAMRLFPRRRTRLGGLLTLHTPRAESIQPLGDLFERLCGAGRFSNSAHG